MQQMSFLTTSILAKDMWTSCIKLQSLMEGFTGYAEKNSQCLALHREFYIFTVDVMLQEDELEPIKTKVIQLLIGKFVTRTLPTSSLLHGICHDSPLKCNLPVEDRRKAHLYHKSHCILLRQFSIHIFRGNHLHYKVLLWVASQRLCKRYLRQPCRLVRFCM